MGGSLKEVDGRGGGPDNLCFFKQSTYFTDGPTNLHQEASGPKVSDCFLRGVHTSIKETYNHFVIFQRGLDPLSPSASPHGLI